VPGVLGACAVVRPAQSPRHVAQPSAAYCVQASAS
jgi:hypothetical protein